MPHGAVVFKINLCQRVLTFDFASDLAPGTEQLEGRISLGVVATAGVDPGLPGSLLNGVPSYDLTQTQVAQPVHNGLQDCDYYFTVTAPTSNPLKTVTRFGLLSVRG